MVPAPAPAPAPRLSIKPHMAAAFAAAGAGAPRRSLSGAARTVETAPAPLAGAVPKKRDAAAFFTAMLNK